MDVGTFNKIDIDDQLKDILPFRINHVPDHVWNKAKKELNETVETKNRCLKKIREMIAEDEVLKHIDFETDFLVLVLRLRKYRIENAFTHLQSNVNCSKKYLDQIRDLPEEYVNRGVDSGLFTVMPKRCPDGCAVVVTQFNKWDPAEIPPVYLERMILMLYSQLVRHPVTQINGIKVILDCRGISTKQLQHMTPTAMRNAYQYGSYWLLIRWKGSYVISGSAIVKAVWDTLLKFSDKLMQRVYLLTSPDELLAYFPRSVFPTTLGGEISDASGSKEWMIKANEDHRHVTLGGLPNSF